VPPQTSNIASTVNAKSLIPNQTYVINGQKGQFVRSESGRAIFIDKNGVEFSTSASNGYSLVNSRKSRKNRKQSRKQSRKNRK